MVRRASRIIQTIRDAILLVLSLILISTDIGPGKELANFVLAGISATIFVLTVVNIILNALKVKRKGYFRGNSIFQLLVGLFLSLGLFPPLGIILVGFNLAVLATLREKKTLEERMKHPPKPITRKYRALVGAGVLVMFVGISVSWLATISFPLIGVYLHTVDLSSVANLVSNTTATIFGLLALVVSPISLVIGSTRPIQTRVCFCVWHLGSYRGNWVDCIHDDNGRNGSIRFHTRGALVLVAPIVAK